MGTGTKYTTKSSLLSSITNKIFTNKRWLTTSDKIQTAIKDVVESLWPSTSVNTLVINDDNVADYVVNGYSAYRSFLENIPEDTQLISVETSNTLHIAGIVFENTLTNGKMIKVIGNISLWQRSYSQEEDGVISQYYYSMVDSHYGVVKEGFQEFMYWNGIWYYGGY